MTVSELLGFSISKIEHGVFPLTSLLQESLFYPACDIDGELIRYCNLHYSNLRICSFVYVDYLTGEGRLVENLDRFQGYHLVAHRRLSPSDVGADKHIPLPDYIDSEEYFRYQGDWKPFAHWGVLERDDEYDESHGPERFSLLFLGAEGVAASSGLYLANKIVPKAIALIQPGHAFGGNWTNFFNWDAPLARTVCKGTSMPEYLFFGGLGLRFYDNCPWPEYKMIDMIDHYYPSCFDSALTVWKI